MNTTPDILPCHDADVARTTAASLMEQARIEATTLLERARVEAAALVDQARVDAAAMLERAHTEAAALVELARREAVKLLTHAHRTEMSKYAMTRPRVSGVSLVLKWLASGTIVAALVMMLLPMWWMFYPYRGMESFVLTSQPGPFAPGGLYTWNVSYCTDVKGPLPIIIHRELESVADPKNSRFPLSSIYYASTEQCESFQRSVVLPTDLPPGQYRLIAHTEVRYNPLHIEMQDWTGDVFSVVSPSRVP